MIAVRSLPALMSALVLAAHFFRAQNLILAAASIGVIALMFLTRPRAALAVRIFLIIGSIERYEQPSFIPAHFRGDPNPLRPKRGL